MVAGNKGVDTDLEYRNRLGRGRIPEFLWFGFGICLSEFFGFRPAFLPIGSILKSAFLRSGRPREPRESF